MNRTTSARLILNSRTRSPSCNSSCGARGGTRLPPPFHDAPTNTGKNRSSVSTQSRGCTIHFELYSDSGRIIIRADESFQSSHSNCFSGQARFASAISHLLCLRMFSRFECIRADRLEQPRLPFVIGPPSQPFAREPLEFSAYFS